MGFVCFVKWKIPLGSTTFHWIPNKPTLSKSTGGDTVPVRARPPAPINAIVNDTFTMAFILCLKRTRTHLNATRTSVAADGLTEANLNFLPTGENANRVRPPAPNKRERLLPLSFVFSKEGRTRTHLDATVQWTVARDGSTERNLCFRHGRKCKSSPVTGTNEKRGLTPLLFRWCR